MPNEKKATEARPYCLEALPTPGAYVVARGTGVIKMGVPLSEAVEKLNDGVELEKRHTQLVKVNFDLWAENEKLKKELHDLRSYVDSGCPKPGNSTYIAALLTEEKLDNGAMQHSVWCCMISADTSDAVILKAYAERWLMDHDAQYKEIEKRIVVASFFRGVQ